MKEIDVAIFILIGALTITLVSSTPALLLTPYILKNQTETARNLSAVDPQLFLNVTSFSGYLTVNEKHNSNLFFWYFPPANKTVTEKTPWIIWLQGGPGASSLAGLFVEIGPFMYDFHDDTLKLREWSWTRNYPLLFIDNPVGAGFSFTDSEDGYAQNMDDVSMHLYSALQQFLEIFPEHRRAPLYLAGESYAGHYLPAFGHRILHPPTLGNFKIKDTSVNLKGIMMGNPIINRRDEMDLLTVFYQWGLLDAEGVEEMKPLQQRYDDGIRLNNFSQARIARDRLLDKIQERISQPQLYNVLRDDTPEIYSFQDFVARPHIKEAIHTGDVKFRFHKATAASKLEGDFLTDLTPKVEELLEHYKVMIYCGQLDLMAPCVPNAEARRRTWRWSGRKAFLAGYRNPWFYNQTLAGYIKIGGNFTEVLVRNAGHLVPMDKPAEAFDFINDFIYSKYLPLPASYVEAFNENLTYNIETPNYPNRSPTETLVNNTGLVVSVVLNVIFVAVIIGGTVHWIRWKKRTDSYFYSMVDNEILDGGLLTMD